MTLTPSQAANIVTLKIQGKTAQQAANEIGCELWRVHLIWTASRVPEFTPEKQAEIRSWAELQVIE